MARLLLLLFVAILCLFDIATSQCETKLNDFACVCDLRGIFFLQLIFFAIYRFAFHINISIASIDISLATAKTLLRQFNVVPSRFLFLFLLSIIKQLSMEL
jgi:hypothetical protein